MTTGLIIVDVQNDYFRGGSMELVGMEDAASQCRKLLEAFRSAQLPAFHIQHLSTRPGAGFFVPDTPGSRSFAVTVPKQEGEDNASNNAVRKTIEVQSVPCI